MHASKFLKVMQYIIVQCRRINKLPNFQRSR